MVRKADEGLGPGQRTNANLSPTSTALWTPTVETPVSNPSNLWNPVGVYHFISFQNLTHTFRALISASFLDFKSFLWGSKITVCGQVRERKKGIYPTWFHSYHQTFRRTYLLTAKKSHAWAGIWINFLQKVKIVESAQVGGGSRVATEKKQHFSSLNSICWSRSIKMAECWRIDAFERWCWRRLLRIPWIVRRSNQSILKEVNPEYSLEGLMLKLKLQYSGRLMWRADSLEKTLILGKTKGKRRRRWQRTRWLDSIADPMDMNLSKFRR